MAFQRRTHTCGELRETHVGQTVVLNGWVNTYRAYNDQVFIDLRDRYGLTQVVFEAEHAEDCSPPPRRCAANGCCAVTRQGAATGCPSKHNPKLATGDIEVLGRGDARSSTAARRRRSRSCRSRRKGRRSATELANEDLRLQYRFLDLRRPTLQRTLTMRHRLNKVIRDYLDEQGFLELETPLLGRSTPEGARDYLVPSRVSPRPAGTPCRSRRSSTSSC